MTSDCPEIFIMQFDHPVGHRLSWQLQPHLIEHDFLSIQRQCFVELVINDIWQKWWRCKALVYDRFLHGCLVYWRLNSFPVTSIARIDILNMFNDFISCRMVDKLLSFVFAYLSKQCTTFWAAFIVNIMNDLLYWQWWNIYSSLSAFSLSSVCDFFKFRFLLDWCGF